MEKTIKRDAEFHQVCYQQSIPEKDAKGNDLPPLVDEFGEVNARCHPDASFRSVTDLIEIVTGQDINKLEELRDEEFDAILVGSIEQDLLWRNFKTLFDD